MKKSWSMARRLAAIAYMCDPTIPAHPDFTADDLQDAVRLFFTMPEEWLQRNAHAFVDEERL